MLIKIFELTEPGEELDFIDRGFEFEIVLQKRFTNSHKTFYQTHTFSLMELEKAKNVEDLLEETVKRLRTEITPTQKERNLP